MLREFGDVLRRAENTPSKTEKTAIIKEALTSNPELKVCFELALSPYITFGVAKLPDILVGSTPRLEQDMAEEIALKDILPQLASRKLTGHAARHAIVEIRSQLNVSRREAFDRILLKDLRAGFSESTVNKAVPGTVPVFECQLAPSEMPKLDELKYPIYAEPKLDGVRTIAIKDSAGVVTLYSRNGIPFENFAEIVDALAGLPHNYVLDGEVISPNGFAALMTRAKGKEGKHADVPIEYHVFDSMHLDDWRAQKCSRPLIERKIDLVSWLPNHPLLKRVTSTLCQDMTQLEDAYRAFVSFGYEGAMVKDPQGLYTFKRNKTWRKLKPFDTIDLRVINMVEGTGKYTGMMGALICDGKHGEKDILTELGTGFSDDDRKWWWEQSPDSEFIIEVRYQEITKAQDKDFYSLRFPSFVRIRSGADGVKV